MYSKPGIRPPYTIPKYCSIMRGTGPAVIGQHVGLLVYIWTVSGSGFWMYPTSIRNNVVYGYVWDGTRYQYTFFEISQIDCLY